LRPLFFSATVVSSILRTFNELKPTKCINRWIYLFIILYPLLHVSATVLRHHQGAHCSWLKLLTSVMELKPELVRIGVRSLEDPYLPDDSAIQAPKHVGADIIL
jgi:hypothetical protein